MKTIMGILKLHPTRPLHPMIMIPLTMLIIIIIIIGPKFDYENGKTWNGEIPMDGKAEICVTIHKAWGCVSYITILTLYKNKWSGSFGLVQMLKATGDCAMAGR